MLSCLLTEGGGGSIALQECAYLLPDLVSKCHLSVEGTGYP